MAKVTAPFLSLSASGTLGKTLTAMRWKNSSFMRRHFKPRDGGVYINADRRTAFQVIVFSLKRILTSRRDPLGVGSQFYLDILKISPKTNSWNNYYFQLLDNDRQTFFGSFFSLDPVVSAFYEDAAISCNYLDTVVYNGFSVPAGLFLYGVCWIAVNYLGYLGFASGLANATALELSSFINYFTVSA